MIYFVRHGLSESNVRGVFAGQRDDSLLTEEGKKQAEDTGKEILNKGIEINRIISSPLKRAFETAEIIAKELNFNVSKIIKDERIMEYDMGSLSGTPWHSISSDTLIIAENAENPQAFCSRLITCIKEYSSMPGNTLIISHGGVGKMLETIKEGRDVKLFYNIPLSPNASIIKIDWI